jgi:hypothetical protein
VRHQLGEWCGERVVDDDHLVLCVVGDVDQLLGEQPDVQGVQDGAGARHRQVQLEVLGVVPHERPDALVRVDPQAPQGVREAPAVRAQLSEGLAAGPLRGPGHHLGHAVHRGAVVEDPRDEQGRLLHGAAHGWLLRPVLPACLREAAAGSVGVRP